MYGFLLNAVQTEDEHDTTWFLLEKGKTVECLVCNQVFKVT